MFKDWLLNQTDRDDPIGDLARDMVDDGVEKFPETDNWKRIESFGINRFRDLALLDILKEAYQEYCEEKGIYFEFEDDEQ